MWLHSEAVMHIGASWLTSKAYFSTSSKFFENDRLLFIFGFVGFFRNLGFTFFFGTLSPNLCT